MLRHSESVIPRANPSHIPTPSHTMECTFPALLTRDKVPKVSVEWVIHQGVVHACLHAFTRVLLQIHALDFVLTSMRMQRAYVGAEN